MENNRYVNKPGILVIPGIMNMVVAQSGEIIIQRKKRDRRLALEYFKELAVMNSFKKFVGTSCTNTVTPYTTLKYKVLKEREYPYVPQEIFADEKAFCIGPNEIAERVLQITRNYRHVLCHEKKRTIIGLGGVRDKNGDNRYIVYTDHRPEMKMGINNNLDLVVLNTEPFDHQEIRFEGGIRIFW